MIAGMGIAGGGVLGMVLIESYLAWIAMAGISGIDMALCIRT